MRYETLSRVRHPKMVVEAARRLREGEFLIHPTSSVYGIGGRPGPETDAEVNRIKGRPSDTPVIRLAGSVDALHRLLPGLSWPEPARRLAERFWPGPLTLVLDDGTTTGAAVRVEAHGLTREVLEQAGTLLSSTSLNSSGSAPTVDSEEAARIAGSLPEVNRRVTLLSGGEPGSGLPSTIVSARAEGIRLIRAGAIARSELMETVEVRDNG